MEAAELRCAIEFRADESRQSPGILHATLMVYETRARSRRETFARGSLEWPEHGIVLNTQHSRADAFARVVPTDRGDDVVIDVALPDTAKGRDIATEMRSERPLYRGMSVEFVAREQHWRNGLRVIDRAELRGAALDTSPDYDAPIEVRASGLAVAEFPLWL